MSGDQHAPTTPGHAPLPPAYTRPVPPPLGLREADQPLPPFYGVSTPLVQPDAPHESTADVVAPPEESVVPHEPTTEVAAPPEEPGTPEPFTEPELPDGGWGVMPLSLASEAVGEPQPQTESPAAGAIVDATLIESPEADLTLARPIPQEHRPESGAPADREWDPTAEGIGPWEPTMEPFSTPAQPASVEAAPEARQPTFVGEAEPRDDRVPATDLPVGGSTSAITVEPAVDAIDEAAARLELLARALRDQGRAALHNGLAREPLEAALAAVVALHLTSREH